jgi:hypothetical protein
MSGTGFSAGGQPNGSTAINQIAEPTPGPTAGSSQLPDFAAALGMSPALASLSAAPPLAQTTGPTGLSPPTFNLFSSPSHTMNTNVGLGGLGPAADPATLVAAVNAARASVEAAASRPPMATAFPGSTPAAEFKDNIRLALEAHLPRLEALARAVVEGMYVHSLRLSHPETAWTHHPSRSFLPKALT